MTRILNTEEVERITGVRFGDRSLLTDACSRESQRFRVFEFYGDSILNLGTILWALHSMRSENTAKRLAANRALALAHVDQNLALVVDQRVVALDP